MKRRNSGSDIIFDTLNMIFLIFTLIIVLYPLIYIVSSSFSSTRAVVSGAVWLYPVEFTLEGYKAIFKFNAILTGYLNSFFYTVLGTAISIILTIFAAYPLTRKEFYGRNIFMGMFVFTMLFSGGMIPTYILIKNLGLYNSIWAMVLPQALSVYLLIITRTYIQGNLPYEMYESASIDGCNDFKFLFSFVFPLARPIIAVIALYYGIGIWNTYFDAMLYLTDKAKWPLQLILRDILIINSIDSSMASSLSSLALKQGMKELLKYSLIVVASLPLLMAYPFVQRFFIKGVMIGSIKG